MKLRLAGKGISSFNILRMWFSELPASQLLYCANRKWYQTNLDEQYTVFFRRSLDTVSKLKTHSRGHRLERKYNENFARIEEVTEAFLVLYNRQHGLNFIPDYKKWLFLYIFAV